jgi:hypothetical protein
MMIINKQRYDVIKISFIDNKKCDEVWDGCYMDTDRGRNGSIWIETRQTYLPLPLTIYLVRKEQTGPDLYDNFFWKLDSNAEECFKRSIILTYNTYTGLSIKRYGLR